VTNFNNDAQWKPEINKMVYLLLHKFLLDMTTSWVNGSALRQRRYLKFVVENSIIETVTLRLQHSMIWCLVVLYTITSFQVWVLPLSSH